MKLPEGAKVVKWQEALIAKAEGHAVFVKRQGSPDDLWDYCFFSLPESFIEPVLVFATKRIPITLDFKSQVQTDYVGGKSNGLVIAIPEGKLFPGTRVTVQLTEIIE